ncbi:MAG TPA: hypothetical protein IAB90_00535 [Candidatus Coproplasma stercoripullorum]|uniref:Uncharacterized protein n=1 Tax=Candidatus Coproplasma stercoripullorum TaxID=2840751 RepID=A0A9D1AEU0_9FIRM|nr:hypothetical protein [Candidatus Coproplasma stercoripullorum]
MQEFLRTVDGLPLVVKIILCIPVLDIFYSICRVIRGVAKGDVLWIVLGVLTVFPGAFFMWILDLIWVLLKGHGILMGETYLG